MSQTQTGLLFYKKISKSSKFLGSNMRLLSKQEWRNQGGRGAVGPSKFWQNRRRRQAAAARRITICTLEFQTLRHPCLDINSKLILEVFIR